jgi:hypothetical protein
MKELSDEAFAAVAEAFGQHAGELAWEPPRPSVNTSYQRS